MPSRASQKVTAFMRFNVTIGTGGYGGALICPTVANDVPYVLYTNSTFSQANLGPVYSAQNVLSNGWSSALMSNLPYATAQLTSASALNPTSYAPLVTSRIVSCGVSSQYIGTLQSLSGLTYCYSSPSHVNQWGINEPGFGAYAEADVKANDQGKCWLVASPSNSTELDFNSGLDVLAAGALNGEGSYGAILQAVCPWANGQHLVSSATSTNSMIGPAIMAIMVTGTVGQQFHFEIIQHCEYIGTATEGRTTPSHADAVGLATVMEAAGKIPALKVTKPKRSVAKLMGDALKEVASELAPAAISAAGRMALAALL